MIRLFIFFTACQFMDESSSAPKFVTLPEDTSVGSEVFRVQAYPRQHFSLQAIDGVSPVLTVFLLGKCIIVP